MPSACYMCDAAATSDEHVPPKCLFPEKKDLRSGADLRKQLITVPSCDVHNTHKSADDEYLLYALATMICSNAVAENHVRTKIFRAIKRNPSLLNKFAETQAPVMFEDPTIGIAQPTIAVRIDDQRFTSVLQKMSRALYFHHFKERWLNDVTVRPEFLLVIDPASARKYNEPVERLAALADYYFQDIAFNGANPDVFKYQVVDGVKGVHKIMRLYFYEGSPVAVFFK
jgi:hypothetical protein